jgi:hypothetical protein
LGEEINAGARRLSAFNREIYTFIIARPQDGRIYILQSGLIEEPSVKKKETVDLWLCKEALNVGKRWTLWKHGFVKWYKILEEDINTVDTWICKVALNRKG